jgi:hypothetical protein
MWCSSSLESQLSLRSRATLARVRVCRGGGPCVIALRPRVSYSRHRSVRARDNEFLNLLNARLHGFLDLITVVVFLLAPFCFGLGGYLAAIAWGLAVVHLLMTLFTRFPLGLVKVIPFPIHGVVELVVGVVLVFAMPRLLGASLGSPARTFFIGAGAVILAVWALTRYRESPRP